MAPPAKSLLKIAKEGFSDIDKNFGRSKRQAAPATQEYYYPAYVLHGHAGMEEEYYVRQDKFNMPYERYPQREPRESYARQDKFNMPYERYPQREPRESYARQDNFNMPYERYPQPEPRQYYMIYKVDHAEPAVYTPQPSHTFVQPAPLPSYSYLIHKASAGVPEITSSEAAKRYNGVEFRYPKRGY